MSYPAITEITKDTFWELIAQAKERPGGPGEWLIEQLVDMGPEQAKKFDDIAHAYIDLSDQYGLWTAASVIERGGCTDDGFIDFRTWLVAQGKAVYMAALRDPDSLADAPDYQNCRFDTLPHMGDLAYEELTGRREAIINYYSINEELARRAKEMNSFYDYKEGSATAEYRRSVDAAARIAEEQKRKVDPIHHERIDRLLDTYARRLAENTNRQNAIAARVPSILIAGGSNFPVRKKEKQNQASDAAMKEWQEIQGLLDKIRGTGKGGISADDPDAIQKLKLKLEGLERTQESMKAVNAYYRKHKTLEGCPGLAPVQIEKLKSSMARDWRKDPKPYPGSHLTNNNAMIRQTKKRIEELSQKAESNISISPHIYGLICPLLRQTRT